VEEDLGLREEASSAERACWFASVLRSSPRLAQDALLHQQTPAKFALYPQFICASTAINKARIIATPAKAKMLEKNRYLVFSTRQSYLGSVSFSGPRVDDQQPRFGRRPLCWYCDDHLKVYSLPTDLSSPASPHISPALTDTLQPCRHVSKSPKMVFPPTGANPVGCSRSSSPSLPLPISFSSVMIRVL
jgi:hypothetical protein